MGISIILSIRENVPDTRRCITSILEQRYDGERELIVLTPRGAEPAADLLHGTGATILATGPETDWLEAVGRAAATARFPLLAFLDTHCVLRNDWLASIEALAPTHRLMTGFACHDRTLAGRFSQLFTHWQFSRCQDPPASADNIFDGSFAVDKALLASCLADLATVTRASSGAAAFLLARTARARGETILLTPELEVAHVSENLPQSLRLWFGIFAPNTIRIRHYCPAAPGSGLLRFGPAAPFLFTAARWVRLTQRLAQNWRRFGFRPWELPVVVAWYHLCLVAYLAGMLVDICARGRRG